MGVRGYGEVVLSVDGLLGFNVPIWALNVFEH